MNAEELKAKIKEAKLERHTWTWICKACKAINSMSFPKSCWICKEEKV